MLKWLAEGTQRRSWMLDAFAYLSMPRRLILPIPAFAAESRVFAAAPEGPDMRRN